MLLNLTDPVTDGVEGTTIGNVVDEEDTLGTAEIGGCDGAETLLAGSVPDLGEGVKVGEGGREVEFWGR